MIELLVVDDHTIFRAGIRRLMSDETDIRVTGEAADSAEALAAVRSRKFGVVLLDIHLGARSGLETLARLRAEQPRLPVIMLSMYAEAQYARRALHAGANAYLSKDVSHEELLRAVRHVAGGGVYVPLGSIGLAPPAPSGEAPVHESLSPREMQVMLKIAQGVPLTEIGVQMCVSVMTIGTHRHRILEKLAISSNAELVQYAVRHGLMTEQRQLSKADKPRYRRGGTLIGAGRAGGGCLRIDRGWIPIGGAGDCMAPVPTKIMSTQYQLRLVSAPPILMRHEAGPS